jgi:hypothetical protein
MAQTDVIFSAVEFVDNIRKALSYPTPSVLANKIKVMFDNDDFVEFTDRLRIDMESKVWNRLLATMEVDGISNESTNWYLHEVIVNNMDIWCSVDVNHDNIISEILHDASGYLAINLNDGEFEDWHGWFDENVSVWMWVEVCTSKFDNKPITEHLDIIEKYCKETGKDVQMFLSKDSVTEKVEVEHPTFHSKTVLDFNMGAEVTEMVFVIINTKVYDGDMGVIVVKGISPMILKDYGFDDEECVEIGKIEIGDSWAETFYGNGVVVVRMA